MSVPNKPTNIIATFGNQRAVVNWTLSVNNGTLIDGYIVTTVIADTGLTYGIPVQVLGPNTSTATVIGLTNGVFYKFYVNAINNNGNSADSDYSNIGDPFTVPESPSNVTAVAGNANATVSWTPSPNNNGSEIYGYTVTSIPDGIVTNLIGYAMSSVLVTRLTNGTSYNFSVVAINAAGSSLAAVSAVSVTPITVPTPPLNVVGSPGNQQAIVTWRPPAFSGGTPVLYYTVIVYLTSTNVPLSTVYSTTNGTDTLIVITGLSVSTSYYFAVKAVNVAGISTMSAYSSPITTFAVPFPPTNIIATGANRSIRLNWTPPTNVAATQYDIYLYPKTDNSRPVKSVFAINSVIDTSAVVYNLSINTSYLFVMTSTNDSGTSVDSLPSNSATTFNIPGPPTSVGAIGGNRAALVTWMNSEYNGGSPIKSYAINVIPINAPANVLPYVFTTSSYPATIPYLLVDTSYAFSVFSVSDVGTSDVSGTSNVIHTYGYPSPPDSVSITRDLSNGKVTLNWIPPRYNGLTDITGYDIVSSDNTISNSLTTSLIDGTVPTTIVITGLTNGTNYTFYIYSRNVVGRSVTYASTTAMPGTNPNAPINIYADPGNQSALVYWTDGFNGGSTILSYDITSVKVNYDISNGTYNLDKINPALGIITPNVTTNPASVLGLQSDASYVFFIKAKNYFGYSPFSSNSSITHTFSIPDIPKNVVAFSGVRSIRIFWSKPIADGGSPVIGYSINVYLSSQYPFQPRIINVGNINEYNITGLLNDTNYTLTLNAINAVGYSNPSPTTPNILTFNYPKPPTRIVSQSGNYTVNLTWKQPYDGGSTIIRYDISGSLPTNNIHINTSILPLEGQVVPSTQATIKGLLADSSYNFYITTVNAVGSSIQSSVIVIHTNSVPSKPVILNAIPEDSYAVLSWYVPYNGGTPITGFVLTSYTNLQTNSNLPPIIESASITVVGNVSTAVFNGLTNNTTYWFTVAAVNFIGTSLESDISDLVTPTPAALIKKDKPIPYCRVHCTNNYKRISTSTNNPNETKRELFARTMNVSNNCTIKRNVNYNDLVNVYGFLPMDISGINQRQASTSTLSFFRK